MEIVARLPQEFIVDGRMASRSRSFERARLDLLSMSLPVPCRPAELVKAVSRAVLDVEHLILEPLAAAESVLPTR